MADEGVVGGKNNIILDFVFFFCSVNRFNSRQCRPKKNCREEIISLNINRPKNSQGCLYQAFRRSIARTEEGEGQVENIPFTSLQDIIRLDNQFHLLTTLGLRRISYDHISTHHFFRREGERTTRDRESLIKCFEEDIRLVFFYLEMITFLSVLFTKLFR